jgi:hypothetical protein
MGLLNRASLATAGFIILISSQAFAGITVTAKDALFCLETKGTWDETTNRCKYPEPSLYERLNNWWWNVPSREEQRRREAWEWMRQFEEDKRVFEENKRQSDESSRRLREFRRDDAIRQLQEELRELRRERGPEFR